MRTLFAASALVACSVVIAASISACSSSELDAEDTATGTTAEALAISGSTVTPKKGGLPPPPPPPPPDAGKPDTGLHHLFGDINVNVNVDVLVPATACYPKTRFDLRRKTRSCEDLPGAYVQGGVTFVPGTGGHYRVGRLLTGTAAPAVLQAKACIFTWEPDSCAAPDAAKLLVETGEKLGERPATCLTNPASCGITVMTPATHPAHTIPNGPGRCDVCGFGSNRTLWVVLPPTWRNFSYTLAGEGRQDFIFIGEAPVETSSPEATVVEIQLSHDIVDQDVGIWASGP